MITFTKPLNAHTAADLLSREVITFPENISLRAAAHVLFQNQISGAPVVDADGRCIGVLRATDFVHWIEDGGHNVADTPLPVCPYQVKGRLLTGENGVICTLWGDSCPFKEIRPMTGGRHTAVCVKPEGALCDWQTKQLPAEPVRHFMTSHRVMVKPQTPLPDLARAMTDAHVHHVIVVDEKEKPIGVVSSNDLLAAMAFAATKQGSLVEGKR